MALNRPEISVEYTDETRITTIDIDNGLKVLVPIYSKYGNYNTVYVTNKTDFLKLYNNGNPLTKGSDSSLKQAYLLLDSGGIYVRRVGNPTILVGKNDLGDDLFFDKNNSLLKTYSTMEFRPEGEDQATFTLDIDGDTKEITAKTTDEAKKKIKEVLAENLVSISTDDTFYFDKEKNIVFNTDLIRTGSLVGVNKNTNSKQLKEVPDIFTIGDTDYITREQGTTGDTGNATNKVYLGLTEVEITPATATESAVTEYNKTEYMIELLKKIDLTKVYVEGMVEFNGSLSVAGDGNLVIDNDGSTTKVFSQSISKSIVVTNDVTGDTVSINQGDNVFEKLFQINEDIVDIDLENIIFHTEVNSGLAFSVTKTGVTDTTTIVNEEVKELIQYSFVDNFNFDVFTFSTYDKQDFHITIKGEDNLIFYCGKDDNLPSTGTKVKVGDELTFSQFFEGVKSNSGGYLLKFFSEFNDDRYKIFYSEPNNIPVRVTTSDNIKVSNIENKNQSPIGNIYFIPKYSSDVYPSFTIDYDEKIITINDVEYSFSFEEDSIDEYGTNNFVENINGYQNLLNISLVQKEQVKDSGVDEITFSSEYEVEGFSESDVNFSTSILNKYDVFYTPFQSLGIIQNIAGKSINSSFISMFNAPDYDSINQVISFKQSVGTDSSNIIYFDGWFKNTSLGFETKIPLALEYLKKIIEYDNTLSTVFKPVFSTNSGNIGGGNVTNKRTDEEIKTILASRINVVDFNPNNNSYYLVTDQSDNGKRSFLSHNNNVRMRNKITKVTEQYTNQFISEYNTADLRETVTEELTKLLENSVGNYNKTYGAEDIEVVCNSSNNTADVINANQLAVEVSVKFSNVISKIKILVRVVKLLNN